MLVVAPLRLVRVVTRLVDRITDDFSNALQQLQQPVSRLVERHPDEQHLAVAVGQVESHVGQSVRLLVRDLAGQVVHYDLLALVWAFLHLRLALIVLERVVRLQLRTRAPLQIRRLVQALN